MALNNTIYSFASLPTNFETETNKIRLADAGATVARFEKASRKSTPLLRARVVERRDVAEHTICITMVAESDTGLPTWETGSHIDVHIRPGLVRQYSLTGPSEPGVYQIAVQKEEKSTGGSIAMHQKYESGALILVGAPRNNFQMDEAAPDVLLFSGGIGMTPIFAMAWRLHELGRPFSWHLSARSLGRLPFSSELGVLPFRRRGPTLHRRRFE